jgi:hypothetical protein
MSAIRDHYRAGPPIPVVQKMNWTPVTEACIRRRPTGAGIAERIG